MGRSVGRAVAVVVVGVVVAALGAEEQGGEHEQTAAEDQHGGEGETGGRVFHGGQSSGLLKSVWRPWAACAAGEGKLVSFCSSTRTAHHSSGRAAEAQGTVAALDKRLMKR